MVTWYKHVIPYTVPVWTLIKVCMWWYIGDVCCAQCLLSHRWWKCSGFPPHKPFWQKLQTCQHMSQFPYKHIDLTNYNIIGLFHSRHVLLDLCLQLIVWVRGENSGDVIVMNRTKIERQNYSGLQMSITWSNIQWIWSTYVTMRGSR